MSLDTSHRIVDVSSRALIAGIACIACIACTAALGAAPATTTPLHTAVAAHLAATASPAQADDDEDAPTAAAPALWVPYDLMVGLHNLPKRYTCEQLTRKFRAVLASIGARPDARILAYQCDPGIGNRGRSPRLHLHFELPRIIGGGTSHDAGFGLSATSARMQTVRLEPGSPSALDDSDCQLLRQMKRTLFSALPLHVVSYHLACLAPGAAQPGFALSLQAPSAAAPALASTD